MKRKLQLSSISCALALMAAFSGYSQNTSDQSGDRAPGSSQQGATQIRDGTPARVNKARSLVGMTVRNQQNQRLGKVKDIVVDLSSGRIAYVVLSTGGFKPKYLALPPTAFQTAADEKGLILNADKERVQQASGFARDQWPNMATPSWGAEPFWQKPEGNQYDHYDKNREYDRNQGSGEKVNPQPNQTPTPATPEPTPTPDQPK